jgi:hypothetical protein
MKHQGMERISQVRDRVCSQIENRCDTRVKVLGPDQMTIEVQIMTMTGAQLQSDQIGILARNGFRSSVVRPTAL